MVYSIQPYEDSTMPIPTFILFHTTQPLWGVRTYDSGSMSFFFHFLRLMTPKTTFSGVFTAKWNVKHQKLCYTALRTFRTELISNISSISSSFSDACSALGIYVARRLPGQILRSYFRQSCWHKDWRFCLGMIFPGGLQGLRKSIVHFFTSFRYCFIRNSEFWRILVETEA